MGPDVNEGLSLSATLYWGKLKAEWEGLRLLYRCSLDHPRIELEKDAPF